MTKFKFQMKFKCPNVKFCGLDFVIDLNFELWIFIKSMNLTTKEAEEG